MGIYNHMREITRGDQDRWLMFHSESDSLFEVFTLRAYRQCLQDDCNDVTGEDWLERMFKVHGKYYIRPRRKLML